MLVSKIRSNHDQIRDLVWSLDATQVIYVQVKQFLYCPFLTICHCGFIQIMTWLMEDE